MINITKNVKTVESGLEDIIERYVYLRKQINNNSAYTKEEVENRLQQMQESDTLNWVLRILDIQDFEMELKDYNTVKLI